MFLFPLFKTSNARVKFMNPLHRLTNAIKFIRYKKLEFKI